MKRVFDQFKLIALATFALYLGIDPHFAFAQGPIRRAIQQRQVPQVAVAAPQPVAVPIAAVPDEPAAQVAGPRQPGPVFCAAVRAHLRQEFRKQGMSFGESVRKANQVTDDVIAGLLPDAEKVASAKMGAKVEVGAIGDGKILKAITDFLSSPAGQEIMAALIKLLLGFIAEAPYQQFWHSALSSWNA